MLSYVCSSQAWVLPLGALDMVTSQQADRRQQCTRKFTWLNERPFQTPEGLKTSLSQLLDEDRALQACMLAFAAFTDVV